MKIVIICGGVGTKMWPESNPEHPKHFLPLIGEKSLFQLNWEILRKKFAASEIFLQTNEHQAQIAKGLISEIVDENIFVEPEMRNQGPATGFAAAQLIKRGLGDEPFMLIQADLLRLDDEKFFTAIDMADEMARKENVYLTGSMVPSSVVAGVDYLVRGELVAENNGVKLYRVEDYIDRNEKEKIEAMLNSGKLMLHWNHSTMTPNNMMKMFEKYRPDWSEPLKKIIEGGDVALNYQLMPKGTLEEITALVHRSGGSIIMDFPFKIWDFGTWESVSQYLSELKAEKLKSSKVIEIEAGNNFVRSDKTVAIIGLNDLVVIENQDGLLICPKSMSGKVGEVPKALETNKQ